MVDPLESELDAAEALGRQLLGYAPRARAANFDTDRRRIVVELTDRCAYAFPPHLVEDFVGADRSDLETIIVDGAGLNLHWPKLNVDLFVPDLIAGIFGAKRWMERRGAALEASA